MERGRGGDEKHFFLLGLIFSSLLENRKRIVSVSFKRLHILNSFEEVKLSICFIICNDLILYKKE